LSSKFTNAGSILVHGFALVGLLSASAGPLQTLSGHVPSEAKSLRAVRNLDSTNQMRLAIGLPLRRQDELRQLLTSLYNPASPGFRHFLQPADFASRFGPTPGDYQAVLAFAASNHLAVTAQHSNRLLVDVLGSVEDIEKTFHLRLKVYEHPTENREFFAPDTEPQFDSPVPLLHIGGLDNYALPRHMSQPVNSAPASGAAQAALTGSGPSGYYAGSDFRAAYAPGVTNTGTGQSVGVLEFAGYFASDIRQYETTFSLPNVPLNNVLSDGDMTYYNDTGAEAPLDIEMVIAMAPGISQVIVYAGFSCDDILSSIATANVAKQISSSWTYSINPETLVLFQQLATQGQSYFNAAGDSDADATTVSTPTDAPYVICVGGTFLTTGGPDGAWQGETVWNRGNGVGTGGGISLTYPIPAWQQGLSMTANQGSTTLRNIPDVAMAADDIWVLFNNGSGGGYGGTSCSAPLWAGFMALVNQQAAANGQPTAGYINPAIYAIGQSADYSSDFHDITVGNNASSSSPNLYNAVAGYDLCTGWGTPGGSNLINALSAPPPTLSFAETLTNTTVNSSSLVIAGTASDTGIGVTTEFQVNGGLWQAATGTTNWQINLNLSPGPSTFQIRAVNSAGKSSTTYSYTVTYSQTQPDDATDSPLLPPWGLAALLAGMGAFGLRFLRDGPSLSPHARARPDEN